MANAWIIQPLPFVSATASSTAVGDAANVATDYAGVVWQSNSATSSTLTLDMGADMAIDTIALFGIVGPPADAQLTVALATAAQGGFAGAFWQSPAQALYAGSQMPVSGKGAALWGAPSTGAPPAAARYVRLTFSSGAAAPVQVSRAVIGKRIQLERNFGFGGSFGVRDLGSLDFSARGVMLRRRGKKLRTAALTFSNVRKDEVEAYTKPLLEQIGNTETVALITDPAPDVQRQNRCYFGTLVGDLGQLSRNAAAWEAKINLVSIF